MKTRITTEGARPSPGKTRAASLHCSWLLFLSINSLTVTNYFVHMMRVLAKVGKGFVALDKEDE